MTASIGTSRQDEDRTFDDVLVDTDVEGMQPRLLCMKPQDHLARRARIGGKDIADTAVLVICRLLRRVDAFDGEDRQKVWIDNEPAVRSGRREKDAQFVGRIPTRDD